METLSSIDTMALTAIEIKKNWIAPSIFRLDEINVELNTGDGADGGGASDNLS